MTRGEQWIGAEMLKLQREGRERRLDVYAETGGRLAIDGKPFLNFASNDYLNLARHPAVLESARRCLETYGAGATASRLVVGTLRCHQELEQRLATLKGYPAALVFGSGYMANVGVIPALVGRGDTVFLDRLAHASLMDGAVLSRATVRRFRHNDVAHLEQLLGTCEGKGRTLVVTESVFSMDGDVAPLADVARVAHAQGAMVLVDEAHATGVFGPAGSGLVRQLKLQSAVNLCMGTLSKALGSYGGFIACSEAMRDLLVNRAKSFIYSTGLPPAAVGAAGGALDVIAKMPDLGAELLARSAELRCRLQAKGLGTVLSSSQVVPIILGPNDRLMRIERRLRRAGVIAAAIRPPTVPTGTARLRLSVTLAHGRDDFVRTAEILGQAAGEEGAL
jgi:8-amino-7-oxononanoate synthase